MAYSTDGIAWTGLTQKNIFSTNGYGTAYSAKQNRWVAGGEGGNSLAYSTDGIAWTGLGTNIITYRVISVAYSAFQDRWVAAGLGTGNTLAYSMDGIAWSGLGLTIFSHGFGVAYSAFQNRWTAAGQGANTLAYSTDGIAWTGVGNSNISSNYGRSVAYSAFQDRWVAAGGNGGHTLAYSMDGVTWSGRGNSIFSTSGYSVAYSAFQNCWTACGTGGNSLAYSSDGINWTGRGTFIFDGYGRGVAYSAFQNRWTAAGQGSVHSLAYSMDGINWTGSGTSIFSVGYGVAYSDPTPFPTTNLAYDFSSLAGTSTTTNGANLMKWTDQRTGLVGTYATSVYNTTVTINSKPTVTGYVTTTYGSTTIPQNSWTFYCVVRTGSTTLADDNALTFNTGTSALLIALRNGCMQCGYSAVGWTLGAASISGGTATTWTASLNTNYIFAVICSGSTTTTSSTQTYTFRINGVDFTPASNTDTGKCYYIYNQNIGNWNNSTQTYMGEQILYNTNHSIANAQSMEQYLSYKWGIGIGATPTGAASSPYV